MSDLRKRQRSFRSLLTVGIMAAFAAATVSTLVPAQDKPSGPVQTCVTAGCHTGIVNRRVMHGPVAQHKCEACHIELDAATHQFDIVGDPAALCTTCHPMQERTFAHEPLRQGNCTGCHDPHGSDHATMLVADPTQGLCLTCHQKEVTPTFVHGPVATGACILCHEAHSSWHAGLLTEPPRKLCLGCHSEIEPDPVLDRYQHEPMGGDCLVCHDAHASDARYHLHEPSPGLCQRCHETTATELAAPVVHGALTEEGGCLTCHAAHYAPFPALQRGEEITVCLECHDQPIATADDRVLTDMAALLSDNPDHHGPIREGTCTPCHHPHASQETQLLRQAYPPDFYAPFEPERYALCFECHVREMVQSRHGTGLTGFRDGDVNLHWLHVNREKGRTCRACHEVHASSNPFHVRDSVPFGSQGWALEIGFTRTPQGGSCAPGCHVRTTYDRGPEPEPGLEAALLESAGTRP
ncbi:MAG: cytochrome c3 family protein [Planctomycetota bacterium]|jgi:predicted CXXCH cytochrome family protein